MTGTERLAQLAAGENPKLIARMKSGFAVMADTQFLPGYCILLAYPEVNHLTDLNEPARTQYLSDMALLGEAVMEATDCLRINYAILGNQDPFLHAHVWPRYKWEQEQYRTWPPTNYPEAIREDPEVLYDPTKHRGMQEKIAARLLALTSGGTAP